MKTRIYSAPADKGLTVYIYIYMTPSITGVKLFFVIPGFGAGRRRDSSLSTDKELLGISTTCEL